ncbi:MAG: lysophospholipid acyltransferase family protein [Pseudomonadota bacterium]
MGLGKRLTNNPLVQRTIGWVGGLYFFAVKHGIRWQIEIPQATQEILDRGGGYIGCFWHGRILLAPAAMERGRPLHMLISGHRDGLLVARGASFVGISTVAGSSRRGGAEAMRRIKRLLDGGQAVAITPDGPRGPRMRAKPGAIKIAQLSGAPLLPFSAAVTRRRLLGSWDRFCLAMPFCRGVVLVGEPIWVPTSLDEATAERLRLDLEQQLNGLTAEADRRCGQETVEPAPALDQLDHARA